ncbi:MAG: phosphoribosylglycinamide formyltransferase [Actinobacteria bacterium]|uniref:phosphoribosylglycinamide formyltransferase 1 n=1 Tax=freshwater metagenome TaxID=449393 RepID=A0A6J7HQ44_9ZZZZ|nr:phosphoribosylglycinamide formyltransferase [Actinomycetota bacterium]MSX24866.1 phosphoribosylglycinamide formyltransferase [Actinomycetota bacterium]MSY45837.1 phosphoribosylglycinamide formyltransferase [Actinomycetota bacterium]MSY57155.1 phosphoribosylglycinamide formyltransferase [Actinomycetota bacterium]MTB00601.1 phosphoribosylglycinamide formyltransferase [Actinomycetota bacterium]
MKPKLVLLASGAGTLVQAIIDAVAQEKLEASISLVLSDQPASQVISRAQEAHIPSLVIPMQKDRTKWDAEIFIAVEKCSPDLVVSAGFMRVLAPAFVERFRTINAHPALLPKFRGAWAISETLESGESVGGTTIHWVDAGVDTGEIIAQREVAILDDDDANSLHERIKIVERVLIVETIRDILPTLRTPDE